MKIAICLFIVSILNFGVQAHCLFGDNLIEMSRVSDLSVSEEIVLDEKTELSAQQWRQVFAFPKFHSSSSFTEVLNFTDDNELWARIVSDKNSKETYAMYLYSSSDTIVGFIADNNSDSIVAFIRDGDITQCQVEFEEYDRLPWYYTN